MSRRVRANPDSWADELFRLVEKDQGYAFISDGIDVLSDEKVVELAEQSLEIQRQLNKKLVMWIRKKRKLLRRDRT